MLGRHTIHLRAESVTVTWSVSGDDHTVDERMELSFHAAIEPARGDELKSFTAQYREGWVTLKPLLGERERNADGQPALGVLGRALGYSDETLDIRVLVQPTYLVGLSTLIARAGGASVKIAVWPFEKLWEWNGEGWLHVRHCQITVGSISL